MLKEILSQDIYEILNQKVNFTILNEIRFRIDKPIVLFMNGKPYFLGQNGLTNIENKAIIATKTMIEDIVYRACDCSIYSVNEQIKRGFVMSSQGVRIGLVGTLVIENDVIKTIRDFTSLNIRIPHEIKGCSLNVFNDIVSKNGIYNTLVIAPPGCGKTTFLRDFLKQLSINDYCFNVLVVDERGEIACQGNGKQVFDIGNFSDVISFAPKNIAITEGVRVMTPHIVVTDELVNENDMNTVIECINSGVFVVSSIHAKSIDELKKKSAFSGLLNGKYFQRFVVLSSREGPGTLEGIYDESFRRINHFE